MNIELPGGTIQGPYETREDWLEARRLGIGGSDIGALLGLSTFTSELEVYYSKVELTPEDEPNEAMSIGRDIEDWVLERWMRREQCWVNSELVTIQSNVFPFLIHSPDALLLDEALRVIGGVEVKNIRSDQAWDPLPEFYMAQVQHGLLCSGLDRWIVIALVGGQKLITREIEPDRELQGRIALAAERFWHTHVLPGVPPDPDGSESAMRALRSRWEVSEDDIAIVPDSDLVSLKHLNDRLHRAEKDYNKACGLIQAKMGPKEHARLADGTKVATWKVSSRKTVETKRLREEMPDIAKKFEKVTPTRVFRPNL